MTTSDLLEHFVNDGVVLAPQGAALRGKSPKELFTALRHEPAIDQARFTRTLAAYLGIRHIDPEALVANDSVITLAQQWSLEHILAFPLAMTGKRLEVAVADPFDLGLIDRLELVTGCSVRLCLTSASAIESALGRYRRGKIHITGGSTAGDPDTNSDPSAISLMDAVLTAAVDQGASDIHLEFSDQGTQIRFRIDGVLTAAMAPINPRSHAQLIQRLKVMADLDVTERRVPQDGRFRFQIGNRRIDFRLSILPGFGEEDAVVRILDRRILTTSDHQLGLHLLGLPETTVRQLRKVGAAPYGLVLIAGPTGSGKTTTLYAMLTETHREQEKIVTIEDPVEYRIDGVLQVPVNEKKQLTFARGLRSILRHDPDKIMVGEIRDPETAAIAVQSALTGHLVLSTLHANTALDVVSRMTHMGVDPYALVNVLSCVVAQRLVRKICSSCKTTIRYPGQILEDAGLVQYLGESFHRGTGCDACNGTGYQGRTTVSELLMMTPDVRRAILERQPMDVIEQLAQENHMSTIRTDAVRKLIEGETTLEEIERVTVAR